MAVPEGEQPNFERRPRKWDKLNAQTMYIIETTPIIAINEWTRANGDHDERVWWTLRLCEGWRPGGRLTSDGPAHEGGERPGAQRQPRDPFARAIREAAERQKVDLQPLIQEMLVDFKPRVAERLRRRYGIPSANQTPSVENLQNMFDLPSDNPPPEDKR